MNVLVIEPGHGSLWLYDAEYVDRLGNPNPRGRLVRGTSWYHESGWNLPDGGVNIPEQLTYPRKWVLRTEP